MSAQPVVKASVDPDMIGEVDPPLARREPDAERLLAEAIVAEHGGDSLSPFLPRPDKSFAFAAGGVLAYRTIGRTAVVSGDPVGPQGSAARLLEAFLTQVHRDGGRVVLYGGGPSTAAAYRELGLRVLQAGEEAVVDARTFTLEGRAVRKLRQSVHRVERHGWTIETRTGAEIDRRLAGEIADVAAAWRTRQPRPLGFAMSFGDFERELRHGDLYLLARAPAGELRAVMRFLPCQGAWSLDTMHRIGSTPNGLNEALICAALAHARACDASEVSLNYAGLAHIVRASRSAHGPRHALMRTGVRLLGWRFQMERLVQFNEKFSPEWRPRYLVYESRAALPGAIVRVLQAEGYLPEPR